MSLSVFLACFWLLLLRYGSVQLCISFCCRTSWHHRSVDSKVRSSLKVQSGLHPATVKKRVQQTTAARFYVSSPNLSANHFLSSSDTFTFQMIRAHPCVTVYNDSGSSKQPMVIQKEVIRRIQRSFYLISPNHHCLYH